MTNIYDLHDKAFLHVSAFVICKKGERVASLAFKFPKDGAGRLWCYIHIFGLEMARGYASGYGYDKRSAAVGAAIEAIKPYAGETVFSKEFPLHRLDNGEQLDAKMFELKKAFAKIGGKDWKDVFRDLGYDVYQAV